MPDSTSFELYKAYVNNTNDFLLAGKEVRRTINRALKENKPNTIQVQTKIYALIYSTYSEANFMKMILTPYGFEQKYIEEILKQKNLQQKWFKVIDLAFKKLTASSKGSEIPNKNQELKRIVIKFVVDPSIMRNKIAHGQISVALNSGNTSLNTELTQKLKELNVVNIFRLFEVNKRLVSIIEDLIESPKKAHYNFYYSKLQDLQDFIDKSAAWDLNSKMQTKSMSKKIRR